MGRKEVVLNQLWMRCMWETIPRRQPARALLNVCIYFQNHTLDSFRGWQGKKGCEIVWCSSVKCSSWDLQLLDLSLKLLTVSVHHFEDDDETTCEIHIYL